MACTLFSKLLTRPSTSKKKCSISENGNEEINKHVIPQFRHTLYLNMSYSNNIKAKKQKREEATFLDVGFKPF